MFSFLMYRVIIVYMNLIGETLFRTEDIPLLNMLQEGIIRKPEMIIKAKNGRKRFVAVSGARLYDERENISGAVVAMHNITKRKEAEANLRISEETFRGSFENAAIGMALVDLSGEWISVNDRLCEMVGYSQEELKNKTFKDITHPEDIKSSLKQLQGMLKGQRDSFQAEKRYIHKNGKVINIILSVSVIKDADSKPFRFVSQITDVTPLKEAEEKLRISEEMFRATFKHAAEGMSIADANGNFLEMNDSLCRMVGYSPDELKTMDFFEITHPDDIEDDIKVFEELLNSEKDFIHKEKRYLHKNGREVPILLSVSVVKSDDSNPLYWTNDRYY